MWVAIFFSGGTGSTALIVYGPFSSQAAAQAFVSGQTNQQFFSVAQVLNPPPYPAGQTAQTQSVAAGQFVVATQAANLTGGSTIYLYGPFATAQAANAYIAGRPFPGGFQVCQVQSPS